MTQHADKYCSQGRAPRFITVRSCVCGVLAIYACLHTYSVYVRARPCELYTPKDISTYRQGIG